ncbi:uncharacterized protein LOC110367615 [Fundulus heteroclitus]|uniref:uncharacterized protein LOC110367615 n=1 Tax=Fundulus heteroclitus TaxID=8078 RepID=UPI00165A9CF8|nr:uncharacterized protein LOC110367615 [Fundulus heteroclitus]
MLKVEEHLKQRATELLEPPSPITSLSASLGTTTLITVEGEVVEVSAVKAVGSIKQKIPLKNIRIKQDQHIIPISLWREAAVVAMAVGDTVTISHVKAATSSYGAQLQSTALTKIKAKEEVRTSTFIVGVIEGEEEESVRVLFEDGETALILNEMWAPFDEKLKKEKVNVQIRLVGKKITEIREM